MCKAIRIRIQIHYDIVIALQNQAYRLEEEARQQRQKQGEERKRQLAEQVRHTPGLLWDADAPLGFIWCSMCCGLSERLY